MSSQEILKNLVKQLRMTPCSQLGQPEKQKGTEVILESDIDGAHYYLIRCQPNANANGCSSLSHRETEITKLVAEGLSNKLIAKELGISPWTVAAHLRRIFNKLDVTSRAAMIAKIAEENLLVGVEA